MLEDPGVLKVGHNIKYDMQVMARYGVEVAVDDTMLLSVCSGGSHGHGLNELATLHLGHTNIDSPGCWQRRSRSASTRCRSTRRSTMRRKMRRSPEGCTVSLSRASSKICRRFTDVRTGLVRSCPIWSAPGSSLMAFLKSFPATSKSVPRISPGTSTNGRSRIQYWLPAVGEVPR